MSYLLATTTGLAGWAGMGSPFLKATLTHSLPMFGWIMQAKL